MLQTPRPALPAPTQTMRACGSVICTGKHTMSCREAAGIHAETFSLPQRRLRRSSSRPPRGRPAPRHQSLRSTAKGRLHVRCASERAATCRGAALDSGRRTLHVIIEDGKLVPVAVQQLLCLWRFEILQGVIEIRSIRKIQRRLVFVRLGAMPGRQLHAAAPQTGSGRGGSGRARRQ